MVAAAAQACVSAAPPLNSSAVPPVVGGSSSGDWDGDGDSDGKTTSVALDVVNPLMWCRSYVGNECRCRVDGLNQRSVYYVRVSAQQRTPGARGCTLVASSPVAIAVTRPCPPVLSPPLASQNSDDGSPCCESRSADSGGVLHVTWPSLAFGTNYVTAHRFGASAPSLVTVVYELMIDDGTLTLCYPPPMESDNGGRILGWSNIQHSARLVDPSASSCGSSGPQPAWKLAAELAGDFTTSDNGDLFASCSLTEVHGSLYCDLPLSLLKHDRVYRLCTRMKFFWIQADATVRHLVYATIRSGAFTTALLLLTFCVCLG